MIKKQFLTALLIAGTLSIVGCNTIPDQQQQQNVELLQKHNWKLSQIGATEIDLKNKARPSLVLNAANQSVSGSDGCNRLVGSYQIKDQQIQFQNMVSTRMLCADNMKQVEQFNQALSKVKAYQVYGSTLRLLDRHGNVLLLFHAAK